MKPINLAPALKDIKSGWVAIDKNNAVVEKSQTLAQLYKKVEGRKDEVLVLPAAENYFGFVLQANG